MVMCYRPAHVFRLAPPERVTATETKRNSCSDDVWGFSVRPFGLGSLHGFWQKGFGFLKCLHPRLFWSSAQTLIWPFSLVFLCFLPWIRDLGLKRNPFINVIVSLCISRFRSDSWKWHRSHYGSFSMPLWQAKMLILPGRRPYTRSSASWTARSQRFSNLPIVCRSFFTSSDFNCLPSISPSFPNLYEVRGSIPIFKPQLLWMT